MTQRLNGLEPFGLLLVGRSLRQCLKQIFVLDDTVTVSVNLVPEQ